MFLIFSASKNVSLRLAVRAFTAPATARHLALRPAVARYGLSSFTTQATVEEDLDAALDDILGGAFKESNGVEPGTHIEGSHPMPKTLVEQVSASL